MPASTGTAAIGTATRLARADHDHGDGYELAQADAEDRASTVFGQVSGERLAQATAVDEGVAFDVDDFPLRADIIGTRDRSRVHVVVPDDGSGNPDRNAVPVEIGHLQATDAHELTMTVGGHAGYRDPSLENFGGSYGALTPNDWVAINILTVSTGAVELDFPKHVRCRSRGLRPHHALYPPAFGAGDRRGAASRCGERRERIQL